MKKQTIKIKVRKDEKGFNYIPAISVEDYSENKTIGDIELSLSPKVVNSSEFITLLPDGCALIETKSKKLFVVYSIDLDFT